MNKGNQNGGSDYAGKHFILTDDINLNGNQWTPIGKLISESQQYSFQNSFDSGGHSVTGLAVGTSSIPASNFDNGLFGRVGEGGALKNLTVSGKVHGPSNSYCGILVGNSRGSIINCHTMGTVLSGSHNGGLAGGNNGSITSCSADVAVSGAHITGGLVGDNTGSIVNCFASGNISNSGNNSTGGAGGLAGYNGGGIANCYATGAVTRGGGNTGGFVGWNASSGTITKGYYNSTDNADVKIGKDGNDQSGYIAGLAPIVMQTQAFADTLNSNIAPESLATKGFFWIWPGAGETPALAPLHDGAGGGAASDPYVIRTEAQLRVLAAVVNAGSDFAGKFMKLDGGIVLTGQWTPIWTKENSFQGSFDDSGYTVSGLAVGTSDTPATTTTACSAMWTRTAR